MPSSCKIASPSFSSLPTVKNVENVSVMNEMPSEILHCIFNHLTLKDRNSVRLVCHLWYNHCCNEKMVIRAAKDDAIQTVQKVLERCKYQRLNLSFQGVFVNKLPVTTWRKIGQRIYSLELYKCQLGKNVIQNVISCCKNLLHLSIHYLHLRSYTLFCHSTTLQKFISKKNVIQSLQTLEIYERQFAMSEELPNFEDYKLLFQIFPNIIHIGLGWFLEEQKCVFGLSRDTCIKNNTNPPSSVVQVFTNLALAILVKDPDDNYKEVFEQLSTLRLTRLEIASSDYAFPKIGKLLKNQKTLQSIRIDLIHNNPKKLKPILLNIFDTNPDLKELRIVYPSITITSKEFQKFCTNISKCGVRCVGLSGLDLANQSISIDALLFKSLTKIDLSWTFNDYTTCLLISKLNVNLQSLRISYTSDEILQHIFKYLVNLKSLRFNWTGKCTIFGIVGHDSIYGQCSAQSQNYSIKCLQNLQKLVICNNYQYYVDQEVLCKLDLPKLQTLIICLKINSISQFQFDILHLPAKMPLLERLELYSGKTSLTCEYLLKFSQLLKHLRYLTIAVPCKEYTFEEQLQIAFGSLHPTFDNRTEVERIFAACPTLKFITDPRTCPGGAHRTFCYDGKNIVMLPNRFLVKVQDPFEW